AATGGLARDRYGVTPGAIAFAQHPRDSSQLLMATNGFAGIYRSADAGRTWRPAAGVPAGGVLAALFAGEGDSSFALQERAVLRSTDGGATWTAISGGPAGPDLAAIEVEPVGRRELYVAAARGALYRSTNGGASWVELPGLPRPARALAWWGATAQSALPTLGAAAGEGVQQLPLRPTLAASPEPGNNRQYFPETGHNVKETFLAFFRARGALDRFGLPRTEELTEDGVLAQYFQRARLEYRPEFRGTPYEVQISLLGEQLLGAARPGPVPAFESSADQRYFVETGHSASYAFLRAFTNRGGLDSFGFPITEELQEGGRPVQYFQRARLEYRAELAGRADEVAIGSIGDDVLRRKGWLD
ncbi:MAG TPA: sialidase family protein, partial [Chloroflexota bacterium]|nr:sialidase family protein [Chloroflexota bacterium]